MLLRRLSTLLLCALLLPACGGGSSPTAPAALVAILDASGGSSDSGALIGDGGFGGYIRVSAVGSIQCGSGDTPPPAPATPTPPSTGTELTNAHITAGTPVAGNVRVSSTLQITAAANPSVITTNTGDVVISGTLLGARTAGSATRAIQINAPAGTIYILGEIRTRGTPGVPDNPDAGAITLTAKRIVITGTLDARGEEGATGTGGTGGAISLDTTAGGGDDLLIVGGTILSGGGAGATQGGKGGDVSALAADVLAVFGTIVTDGGAASSPALFPTAGNAGAMTLRGNGSADLVATLSLRGGFASGVAAGAVGGNGGSFLADAAVPYKVYGSITTAGGGAVAQGATAGTPLKGGDAGTLIIGSFVSPAASVEIGRGDVVNPGGSGKLNGSSGGSIDVESWDGDVRAAGRFVSTGGSGRDAGGAGGYIKIETDQQFAGNTSNHRLEVDASIDASDGPHALSIGGHAGVVFLYCGGDLTWNGTIDASGKGNNSFGNFVNIRTQAANLAPTGKVTASGSINAQGKIREGAMFNGPGKDVRVSGATGLTFTGSIVTRGFDSGLVSVGSLSGDVDVTATIVATTDGTTNLVRAGGSVGVGGGGNVRFSGSIDVSAGNVDPATPNLAGGPGGIASVGSSGASGTVTVVAGTNIRADGGDSTTGAGHFAGGAGGRIQLSSVGQPIVAHGTFRSRGGANPADAGGPGGQFSVDSDSDKNGTGGAITLAADVLVDVSGGAGATGGSALNNGGVAPADSSNNLLAVILDAAGGFTSSPDGPGVGAVVNLGTIIATAGSPTGRGGDLWFDGSQPGGAELTPGNSGTVVVTGGGGSGAFFPN